MQHAAVGEDVLQRWDCFGSVRAVCIGIVSWVNCEWLVCDDN